MQYWKKRYHSLYLNAKSEFDPHIIEWIAGKEDIVCASPYSYPLLKHDFKAIRRFKSGKVRIFYVLSKEKGELWDVVPNAPEVLFVYVELRRDETYANVLKALRRNDIL